MKPVTLMLHLGAQHPDVLEELLKNAVRKPKPKRKKKPRARSSTVERLPTSGREAAGSSPVARVTRK